MPLDSKPSSTSSRRRTGRSRLVAIMGFGLAAVSTLVSLGALFSILLYLIIHGVGALDWNFLIKEPAAIGETGGGIGPSILGTAILVTIAMIVGVPLGIGVAVYLSELAGETRFARITRVAINTFIGVPTIIVGIFVYFILVKPTHTFSAVAGGLALGIIMIPIMARTAEDVLRLVPTSIREAGLALGAPKWRVTFDLVLPAARAGVVTGGVLATARVAGETAPLILTALGNEYYPTGLFKPTDEITLRILKYARGPYHVWHQQAYGAALLLVFGVAVGSLLLRLSMKNVNTGL